MVTSTTDRIFTRAEELSRSGEVAAIVADLTIESEAAGVVAAAIAHFGSLSILINNAGMTSVGDPASSSPFVDTSTAEWRHSLDRDLTSAFLVTRAALPHLLAAPEGRIVNVASITGPLMAIRNDVAYAAGKAAMVGMTRALAVDLAPSGVTVNAVAPGWIATGSASEHENRMGLATPAKRSGKPEEVAAAVTFLVSEGASYITGQAIVVDGGNSVMEERG
jgi:3-oxoacyl-[acyl-carrier protein] reductase